MRKRIISHMQEATSSEQGMVERRGARGGGNHLRGRPILLSPRCCRVESQGGGPQRLGIRQYGFFSTVLNSCAGLGCIS